jgi:hypothetical protein
MGHAAPACGLFLMKVRFLALVLLQKYTIEELFPAL